MVAVFDETNANRKRATELCAELGYRVITDSSAKKVAEALRGDDAPDAVLVGVPGGEDLIAAARAREGVAIPVIAALAGPAATAAARCDEVGADLFAVRPLAADSLATALRAARRINVARSRLRATETTLEGVQERLQRYGESDTLTGFQHFDFFERLLVMELKRAKRYGYSLAMCLVAIDPWDGDEPSPDAVRKLRARVAQAVAASIRDIDWPVDVSEDRFLVFLPHADLAGAERVGRRIADVVRTAGSIADGDRTLQMSVSVGISALRAGKPVSFARLMRDAQQAVRAAQLKGGGRVVVRT